MIALLIGLAFAGESPVSCDVAASMPVLAERGDQAAYLCLVDREDARPALLEAIRAATPESAPHTRYTRALTLWLIARGDKPWDAADVRLLNAGDRRLLADGVRARTGQRSGSAEHEAIFAQQPWYHPRDNWTVARLSATEVANIAMADDPPPAPATVVSTSTTPTEPIPPTGETVSAPVCGCDGLGGVGGVLGAGLALVLLRRRRYGPWRKTTGPTPRTHTRP